MDEFERIADEPLTSKLMKEELEIVEKEHEEDMKRLYDRHAAIYFDEMQMAYASNDPSPEEEDTKQNIAVSPPVCYLKNKLLIEVMHDRTS
jgi:hypothetical protein